MNAPVVEANKGAERGAEAERVETGYIHVYIPFMAIHLRILESALRICRERGAWTFRPAEIVAAAADLNAGSVRTHVMSRCCVNAPSHHAHRWPYFRRLRRGVYQILPAWRRKSRGPTSARRAHPETTRRRPSVRRSAIDSGILVDVRESAGRYVAEVPGLRGKVRASTLDEMAKNLRRMARDRREAGAGLTGPLRLRVEIDQEKPDRLIEAYERDIDRTLVRQALRMSFEERLLALERWINAVEEIRGAARRSGRKPSG